LLTWLLAPFLLLAPMTIEGCSLYWFLLEHSSTAELDNPTTEPR